MSHARGPIVTLDRWCSRINENLARSLGRVSAVIAVLLVLVCAYALGVYGWGTDEYGLLPYSTRDQLYRTFFGAVVGGLVGYLVAVLVCGLIAVFVNIRDLLAHMATAGEESRRD